MITLKEIINEQRRKEALQLLDDTIENMKSDLARIQRHRESFLAERQKEFQDGEMNRGGELARILNRTIYDLSVNTGRNFRLDLMADSMDGLLHPETREGK